MALQSQTANEVVHSCGVPQTQIWTVSASSSPGPCREHHLICSYRSLHFLLRAANCMQVVHLHRTHDPEAGALYADYALQLHAGNIVCDWDRYVTPVPPHGPDESSSDAVCAL